MSKQQVELPKYQCHKQVRALKIKSVVGVGERFWMDFEGDYPIKILEKDWLVKHKPEVGGYFVVYEDGYESYSPVKAFEDGYKLLDGNDNQFAFLNSYTEAVKSDLFHECRGIMGTENIGQDDALRRVLVHFLKAIGK